MQFRRPPSTDEIFRFVSIPDEMTFVQRAHLYVWKTCNRDVRNQVTEIQSRWNACFHPEPDVTDSVMRVYSKLATDETLILKGFKIGASRARTSHRLDTNFGWFNWKVGVFGGVPIALFIVLFWTPTMDRPEPGDLALVTPVSSGTFQGIRNSDIPLARIRVQERNTVRVKYVQPELLQSVEFETTSPP